MYHFSQAKQPALFLVVFFFLLLPYFPPRFLFRASPTRLDARQEVRVARCPPPAGTENCCRHPHPLSLSQSLPVCIRIYIYEKPCWSLRKFALLKSETSTRGRKSNIVGRSGGCVVHCLVTHCTDPEQFDRCRERRKRLSARGGESVSPSDSHRWLSAKLCFGWLAVGLPTDSTGSNKKKKSNDSTNRFTQHAYGRRHYAWNYVERRE